MQFFETSAKASYNVNETFTFLTKEILSNTDAKPTNGPTTRLDSNKKDGDSKNGKKGCC
jgi:hypothetical protein